MLLIIKAFILPNQHALTGLARRKKWLHDYQNPWWNLWYKTAAFRFCCIGSPFQDEVSDNLPGYQPLFLPVK